jgi:hypothetical protein
MGATGSKTSDDMVVQEHCIDLPGESVQCWVGGGTDKLKVVLRKHRDVIFDIKLGNGKTYVLEATDSDFYNARDKKLIFAAQHGKVTFKDGERMHVWVSRGFKGALVLKCDGQILSKVEPNEWDKHRHSDDPKEKPAPIIISLGDTGPPPAPLKLVTSAPVNAAPAVMPAPLPRSVAAPIHDETCPVVCVVDGKLEGIPAQVWESLKKGGDKSGFADIDPNHVATRNWIWGQVAGTGAYIADNWTWLRASLDGKTHEGFKLVKAQVHYVRGKIRFYFSGYSNSNTVFGRGGFGPAHDRIVNIFAGMGKTESSFAATVKGVTGTFKGNALVSFIFGAATSIAEWKDDAKKDGYDLAAALVMAAIKAIVVAALVVVAVAVIVWFVMVVIGAAIPVIVVGAITIGLSFAANYLIESLDKKLGQHATGDPKNTDGLAASIAPWFRKAGKQIEDSWHYLMGKFPKDYKEIHF